MRTPFPFFLLCLALLLTASCEQIAEITGEVLAEAPEVTYSKTTYEAEFYVPGSSSVPSIDWNGDPGTIDLGTTIEGLTINTTTGKLEWTKMLPPGTHEVDVVVANSEGQIVVPITIDNPLRGKFVGDYNDTYYFAIDFAPDGTLTLAANSATNPDTGTGTWTLEDGEVIAEYLYTVDPTFNYSWKGSLAQTETTATIAGNWYNGEYDDSKEPTGTFELELE